MGKLEGLKKKYPMVKFKYEPMGDCKRCSGTGERYIKKQQRSTFCICTMVSHDFCDAAAEALSKSARKFRAEMGGDLTP